MDHAGKSFEDIQTLIHSVSEHILEISALTEGLFARAAQIHSLIEAVTYLSETTIQRYQHLSEESCTTEEIDVRLHHSQKNGRRFTDCICK